MPTTTQKRQTCCLCLNTTTDYVTVHPVLRPEARYHYCRENGCATKVPGGEVSPASSVRFQHVNGFGKVETNVAIGYDAQRRHVLTSEGGRVGMDHVFIRDHGRILDAFGAR
jgi:hypothetical protein